MHTLHNAYRQHIHSSCTHNTGPTAQQAAPVNGYRAYDPSVPYNAPAPSVPYQTQVTEAAGADPVKNEINVPRLQYQVCCGWWVWLWLWGCWWVSRGGGVGGGVGGWGWMWFVYTVLCACVCVCVCMFMCVSAYVAICTYTALECTLCTLVPPFNNQPHDNRPLPTSPPQDTNVVFEINRMWKLAKKPVLVCMAIDTSLSMSGTNDMQDVKNAALSFIQSMTDNDYMRLLRFDQHVGVMQSGMCWWGVCGVCGGVCVV